MTRRGYGKLLFMPAWGLYDRDGKIIASIRAPNAVAARQLFRISGMTGERVKRIHGSV